jgi:tRNA uridine 5-carboxymethylaminomethyl modification enzyme
MFTSRAEYRLLLRHDNADLRLMEKGHAIGLLDRETYERFTEKRSAIMEETGRLGKVRVKPSVINPVLKSLHTAEITEDIGLEQLLKRPEVTYAVIKQVAPPERSLGEDVEKQVEIQIKYQGYIRQQMETAGKLSRLEDKKIPPDFDYRGLPGISREIFAKLEEVRPVSLGQAGRIQGMTPAALSIIMVAVEKIRRERSA